MRMIFDVGYIHISFILVLRVRQITRIKIELMNVIGVTTITFRMSLLSHQLHSLIQF
jgi:hypothetical protein